MKPVANISGRTYRSEDWAEAIRVLAAWRLAGILPERMSVWRRVRFMGVGVFGVWGEDRELF